MRTILSIAVLFFLLSSAAEEGSVRDLATCIDGFFGEKRNREGPFSTVLSSDATKEKGSLLVLTEIGAKIVDGRYDQKNGKLVFTFTPQGQQEKIVETYDFRNEMSLLVPTVVSATESPFTLRKAPLTSAAKFAGDSLIKRARQESVNDDYFSDFERFVNRLRSESKHTELNFRLEQASSSLGLLASCDKVSNRAVKEAKDLEVTKLRKFITRIRKLAQSNNISLDVRDANSGSPAGRDVPAKGGAGQ